MIGSLITVVVVGSASTVTQMQKTRFAAESSKIEMQQKARTILNVVSGFVRSSGASRQGSVFSAAPYTTSSSLPVPEGSPTSVRVRSDINDDGGVGSGIPEDVLITWNSATKVLMVGPTVFQRVQGFTLRYFDSNGSELVPPSGGWNIASDASHGMTLRSIVRIEVTINMEARARDLATKQLATMSLTSEVTIINQVPL